MNAGAIVAVMAAAAAQKARQDAEDAFRLAGATSSDRARPLSDLGLADNPAVHGTLRSAGIVRGVGARGQVLSSEEAEAHATAWYLDEAAILAERTAAATRGNGAAKVAITIIAIMLLLVVVGLMLIRPGSSDM
jgi:hypothetical protein